MEEIPLLIIGAGPAGLSTALHLVQIDPSWAGRLVVLDRAAHPRHKLCGGGVTRLGLQYLRDLGLPDPLPIPQAPVHDARFIYDRHTVHVRGKPEFVVFHRREFDAYLAQTAAARGIRIHEHVRVREIRIDTDGVTVTSDQGEYRAFAVVGADGSRGVSRQTIPGRDKGPGRRRAPAARVARLLEVVQPAAVEAPQFSEAFARFDFSPAAGGLQGYTWDFPARVEGDPHHNRGVYDARMVPDRPKAALPDLLHQTLEAQPPGPGGARIEGHPIHWFSPRNPLAAERLILVGDAAGAEPLFGEGIAPAIGYGKIAARSVAEAFARGNFSFKDYKPRLLVSPLGGYLMLRWWTAWWVYHFSDRPWFMRMMWAVGKGLAAITNGRIGERASRRTRPFKPLEETINP